MGSTSPITASVLSHRLCASAEPVPASVPAGKKYQPNAASGHDFRSGDAATGWKCLKFEVNSPVYYRYNYRQGADYIVSDTTARPSARGFEASAQGDLDGNGTLSTLAVTGDVDATTRTLTISTQIYVNNEVE